MNYKCNRRRHLPRTKNKIDIGLMIFNEKEILLFVPTLSCGYNRCTMTRDAKPISTRKRARILVLLTALLACVQLGAAVRALQVPDELAAKISLPLPLDFIASLLWAFIALA